MMYLILTEYTDMCGYVSGKFEPMFTSDLHRVSFALKKENVRVFKIDTITEVKEVEVSYNEITTEME